MAELPKGYTGKLILSIDCSGELPAEEYFENGVTKVVESPVGSYREAGEEPPARFGYRFQMPDDADKKNE